MAIVLALTALIATTEPQSTRYAGRPLSEVLTALQQRGLPIVYSSAVVTASMMVASEPRASEPRRVLDELLGPHRLEVKPGPGGILQIVRAQAKRAPRRDAIAPAENRAPPSTSEEPAPLTFDERIEVVARAEERFAGAAVESIVGGDDLRQRSSVLANDPLVALHTLPRIAAISDFRSEFAVRGSGPRHLAVIVDGVSASDMRHAVYGMRESAMLAMINPDVVDRATVQVGAYPRRFADALGGEVGITLREGSRTHTRLSGSIGGVAATLVGEGPLGSEARGSWLLSARQSFLDWPTTSFAYEYGGTGFGYRDLQAKTVYDVSPSQRVSLSVIAGHSLADNGDEPGPGGFFQGSHDAALVTSGWRSTFGDHFVVRQRAHFLSHMSHNTDGDGMTLMNQHQRTIGYRADVTRAWRTITLATGGQFEHRDGGTPPDTRAEAATYADAMWRVTPSLTVTPGVRMTDASRSPRMAVSPALNIEWRMRPGWILRAASAVGHQLSVFSRDPERARYVDVSIERAITPTFTLEASVYHRRELDIIDSLGDDRLLEGQARGVELAAELLPHRGVAGSIAYSYGRTRYIDRATGVGFRGDFDQPHAVNAFLSYQFSRATLAAAFRSGSNFPIAGYFSSRAGALVPGELRNAVRRPGYARLDVQMSRSFSFGRHEMTLVGEVLNVLNRTNYGPANGFISADGLAIGYSEKLMPRFASAALRIAF